MQGKKIASMLLVGSMALALAGCGDSQTGRAGGTWSADDAAEMAVNAEEAVSERPDYVRDEDEITGKITVYTALEETVQEVLKDLWDSYYPNCTLEFQADSLGTLVTRIRGDENNDADIIVGGLIETDGDEYHDILQPYTSVLDDEAEYHDPSGYYTYYDVSLMCLVVNPELRDELGIEINGYEDLLNPALDGKIILATPDASSSGWRQLQTICATMGDSFNDEKCWDYIARLMPSCFCTTSSKDVYNLVINGEYVVGLSYEPAITGVIKEGAPVECVYMEEGDTGVPSAAAITKNCSNVPAAQAMIDLLASTEFQNARMEIAEGRGANKYADLGSLPALSTLNMVDLDIDYLSENRDAMCQRWNDLWADTH